jgi:type II secretion system protein H
MPIGFTLIELMVVIVLVGLMAAIASVPIADQIDQSRLDGAIDRIVQADQAERTSVRTSPQPGQAMLDSTRRSMQFLSSSKRVEFGRTIQIAEVLVVGNNAAMSPIVYSQTGQSRTYAIRLQTARGASKWLMIIGNTGQTLIRKDANEIRKLFALGTS